MYGMQEFENSFCLLNFLDSSQWTSHDIHGAVDFLSWWIDWQRQWPQKYDCLCRLRLHPPNSNSRHHQNCNYNGNNFMNLIFLKWPSSYLVSRYILSKYIDINRSGKISKKSPAIVVTFLNAGVRHCFAWSQAHCQDSDNYCSNDDPHFLSNVPGRMIL